MQNNFNDILALFSGQELKRESAKSWCGPCPVCGGNDRFVIWPEDAGRGKVPGRYHCRQCGIKGDALSYLIDIEGMKYQEAAQAVGLKSASSGPIPCRANSKTAGYTPKAELSAPCQKWQATAARIVKVAQSGLDCPDAREEMQRRFLTMEQAQALGLGWLARDVWLIPSTDLGLEPEYKADGRAEKKTCLPCGLVIPVFQAGNLVAVEVRRKRGTENTFGKYAFLRGGGGHYMAGQRGLPLVVAESKLDCMRLNNICGVGVLAMPANHKPTAAEFSFLQAAACVIVSLDNDKAGAKAKEWWLDGKLPRAREARPTTGAKNFGDLPDADLWEWIEAEIEAVTSASNQPEQAKQGASASRPDALSNNMAKDVHQPKNEAQCQQIEYQSIPCKADLSALAYLKQEFGCGLTADRSKGYWVIFGGLNNPQLVQGLEWARQNTGLIAQSRPIPGIACRPERIITGWPM